LNELKGESYIVSKVQIEQAEAKLVATFKTAHLFAILNEILRINVAVPFSEKFVGII
jgi:hypothetical protein